MANQTAACLAAYGSCRKSQDVAGTAISTCEQIPSALTSKLKQLNSNQLRVNQAQADRYLITIENLSTFFAGFFYNII